MRCPYCRQSIPVSHFCPHCGEEILRAGEPQAEGIPGSVPARGDIVGKMCPYDQYRIEAGEAVIVCRDCGTPHHVDCWRENDGCTTFGCSRSPSAARGPEPPAVAEYADIEQVEVEADAGEDRPQFERDREEMGVPMAVAAANIRHTANNALAFALLGILFCPVFSFLGLIMSVTALYNLRHTYYPRQVRLQARTTATWALVTAIIVPIIQLVIVTSLGAYAPGA